VPRLWLSELTPHERILQDEGRCGGERGGDLAGIRDRHARIEVTHENQRGNSAAEWTPEVIAQVCHRSPRVGQEHSWKIDCVAEEGAPELRSIMCFIADCTPARVRRTTAT
jgi:hypothetical protein